MIEKIAVSSEAASTEEKFIADLKNVFEDLRFAMMGSVHAMAGLVDLCDAHEATQLSDEGKRAFGDLFCASMDFDDFLAKEEAKAARKKGLRDILSARQGRRRDEPTSH